MTRDGGKHQSPEPLADEFYVSGRDTGAVGERPRLDEPTLTRILSELAPIIGGDLLDGGVPYRVALASAILDRSGVAVGEREELDVERLAEAMLEQHVTLQPNAKPMSTTLIREMARDLVRRYARLSVNEGSAPVARTEAEEWQWKGDFPGERHGAGDGWTHVHSDGSRWVHPEKVCPARTEAEPHE